jgi:hypothetical protein
MTRSELIRRRRQMHRRIQEVVAERRLAISAVTARPQPEQPADAAQQTGG